MSLLLVLTTFSNLNAWGLPLMLPFTLLESSVRLYSVLSTSTVELRLATSALCASTVKRTSPCCSYARALAFYHLI